MTKATTTAVLNADMRDRAGKGAARALRREGKVPGILYGTSGAPTSIALKLNELTLEYQRGRFRSRLVDIKLGNQTVKVLPKDLQFHPVSDQIEHVDFIKVESGVPLRVMVPVKFLGQEKSVGIKRGGVLNVVRHEIEFICAPESIPTHIEVNVQEMDIGDAAHINDITLPKGITPTIKRNFTVATVAGRRAEEEEVKPAAATTVEGAVPAEGAAAAAPGAAPAPGAAAPATDAKKEETKKK